MESFLGAEEQADIRVGDGSEVDRKRSGGILYFGEPVVVVEESRGKGQPVFVSVATAGQKPAYIEDPKRSAAKSQGRGAHAADASRATWNQEHVNRCFRYYADERDVEALLTDWGEPQPSQTQSRQGVEWLLEIGTDNTRQAGAVPEALSVLVGRRAISWEVMRSALRPYLERIEDLRTSSPQVDAFLHEFLAALITAAGKNLPAVFFESFPPGGGKRGAITYGLLLGALLLVRQRGGVDAVKRHLDGKELPLAMCRAKSCTPADLRAILKKGGAL